MASPELPLKHYLTVGNRRPKTTAKFVPGTLMLPSMTWGCGARSGSEAASSLQQRRASNKERFLT